MKLFSLTLNMKNSLFSTYDMKTNHFFFRSFGLGDIFTALFWLELKD